MAGAIARKTAGLFPALRAAAGGRVLGLGRTIRHEQPGQVGRVQAERACQVWGRTVRHGRGWGVRRAPQRALLMAYISALVRRPFS